jgi:hypothetical protein
MTTQPITATATIVRHRRTRIAGVLAIALGAGGLAVPGAAAADPSAATPVVVAEHLRNPRQLAIGWDGSLYIAEAGTGQVGASDQTIPCTTGPEGAACVGDTAALTRVRRPSGANARSERIVTGLLSSAAPDGSGATGLDAVSFDDDGRLYGIMTHVEGALPDALAASNGQLIRIRRHTWRAVADIGTYSLANPLPDHEPDSNPYGVLATEDGILVADAGNNIVVRVNEDDDDSNNNIEPFATFQFRPRDPLDGVPTSIAKHGGLIYVGQLSSLAPGKAKVTVFDRHGVVQRTIEDLTSVNGIAVARNGDVYVTEVFTGRPFASPGALVKIPADGSARVTTSFPAPGGVALDRRGNVFVSINSRSPDGSVARLPR